MLAQELHRYLGGDAQMLLGLFLFAVLIEIPRYVLTSLYVGLREVCSSTKRYKSVAKPGITERRPTISVLLPGHNEGDSLERAIRGLNEQIVRPDQIVVVDDGSTDDMAVIGRNLKAKGLVDIFLSTGLRGGKPAALNLGLQFCTGDIIVMADIDTSFDRDAIARLI